MTTVKRFWPDGSEWDFQLPYAGIRPEKWGCRDGVTYLTDGALMLRLPIETQSPEEMPYFDAPKRCRLADAADGFRWDAWQAMPRRLALVQDEAGEGYDNVRLARRTIDLTYLLWLTHRYGIGEWHAPNDDPQTPIWFRFGGETIAVVAPIIRAAAPCSPVCSFSDVFPSATD